MANVLELLLRYSEAETCSFLQNFPPSRDSSVFPLCISESSPDPCSWGFMSVNTPFQISVWSPAAHQPPATSPSVFVAAHIHLGFPAKNCSQEAKHVSDRNQAQYFSWNQIILSHFINGNEQKFSVLVLMFLIQESPEKEMHLHHTGGASGSLLGHHFTSRFQPARPVIY